ncbi:MAG TPA: hypothetical protein VGZ00_06455 [Candidatus Baltobacteraceae bacterium]|jgi:hypothetical protein|nr:hypothetical protein [Candidatus Baltobacteraceae bacterium]
MNVHNQATTNEGRVGPTLGEPRTFSIGELDRYISELDRRLPPLKKSAREELERFGKIPPEMPEDPVLESARKRNAILKEAVEAYERSPEGRELTRIENQLQGLTPESHEAEVIKAGRLTKSEKKALFVEARRRLPAVDTRTFAGKGVTGGSFSRVVDIVNGLLKEPVPDAPIERSALVCNERVSRIESARQALNGKVFAGRSFDEFSNNLEELLDGSHSDELTERIELVRRERASRIESARQAVEGELADIEKMRAVDEEKYQADSKRYIDYRDACRRLEGVESAQKQVVRLKALLSGRRSTDTLSIDQPLPDDDPVIQTRIISDAVNAERRKASRENQLKNSEKQRGATWKMK